MPFFLLFTSFLLSLAPAWADTQKRVCEEALTGKSGARVAFKRKDHLPNRTLALELLRMRREGILLNPSGIYSERETAEKILDSRTDLTSFLKEVAQNFKWEMIHQELGAHERSDTYWTVERLSTALRRLESADVPINTAQLRFDRDGRVAEVLRGLNYEVNPRAILTAASARFGGLPQMLNAFGVAGDRAHSDQPATAEDVMKAFQTLENLGLSLRAADVEKLGTTALKTSRLRIRSFSSLRKEISIHFGSWSEALKAYGKNPRHLVSSYRYSDADIKQILTKIIEAKLPISRPAELSRDEGGQLRDILKTFGGPIRSPSHFVGTISDRYGGWFNALQRNGIYGARWIPLNIRWNFTLAKTLMQFAVRENLPLSYTGIAEDRGGRINEFINKTWPGLGMTSANFAKWVWYHAGSWESWLIRFGVDPQEVRLKQTATTKLLYATIWTKRLPRNSGLSEWNAEMAKQTIHFALTNGVAVNYVGFSEDRHGKIADYLRTTWPEKKLSARGLVNWARKTLGSWDTFLVTNNINPDQHRRWGEAEFKTLDESMKRDRRHDLRYRDSYLVLGARQNIENDESEIIAVDANTPQTLLEQKEFGELFANLMADFSDAEKEIIQAMLEYVELNDDVDFFGDEFADHYRDNTGSELSRDLLNATISAMKSNEMLSEFFKDN